MDSNKKEIWETSKLMQASLDLKVYRQTLAFTIGNLVIMTIITCSLSIFEVFSTTGIFYIVIWILISVSAILLHLYVFRNVFKQFPYYRYKNFVWSISYNLPIILGYFLNTVVFDTIISPKFLWYPLIGIGSLIIGLTIEKYYYNQKELFARCTLWLGGLLLITTPFLHLIIINDPLLLNSFFIPGFSLILASLATSYSIAIAEKKVLNT